MHHTMLLYECRRSFKPIDQHHAMILPSYIAEVRNQIQFLHCQNLFFKLYAMPKQIGRFNYKMAS